MVKPLENSTSDHDISLQANNLMPFAPFHALLSRIFWGAKQALSISFSKQQARQLYKVPRKSG